MHAQPVTPYRMRDLCELTGLSRQAIHFYIAQGLVPEGTKTGRNMAYYGPEHVERLQLVRRLQEERFLPLKAIRALLAAETAAVDPAKRALLAEVGARLGQHSTPTLVDAAEACERRGVPMHDFDEMVELGMIAAKDGKVSSESLWLLEAWGQFRALGFTDKLGFSVRDLQAYESAAADIFDHESQLALARMSHLDPAELATMIERALPLVHAVLIHFHTAALKTFFAALEARP
jgi:DNA-binding transcriptional MerR regulator